MHNNPIDFADPSGAKGIKAGPFGNFLKKVWDFIKNPFDKLAGRKHNYGRRKRTNYRLPKPRRIETARPSRRFSWSYSNNNFGQRTGQLIQTNPFNPPSNIISPNSSLFASGSGGLSLNYSNNLLGRGFNVNWSLSRFSTNVHSTPINPGAYSATLSGIGIIPITIGLPGTQTLNQPLIARGNFLLQINRGVFGTPVELCDDVTVQIRVSGSRTRIMGRRSLVLTNNRTGVVKTVGYSFWGRLAIGRSWFDGNWTVSVVNNRNNNIRILRNKWWIF
jgi:hypothetical protein